MKSTKKGEKKEKKELEGIFLPSIKLLINSWEVISLGKLINRKKPNNPVISETYIILTTIIGFIILLISSPIYLVFPNILLIIPFIWITYRLVEIFLFLVGWIFVHEGKVVSYRRSILGFALNILEISILITSIRVLINEPISDKLKATIVTIVDIVMLNGNTISVLGLVQFVFGVLLVFLIIASLASGLLRKQLLKQ